MRIGIDLDGVVFDTESLWAVNAEMYDILNLKRDSVVNKYEPRVQEKYNWSEEEINNYFDKYVYIDDFDLVSGAKEVLKKLNADGHELIVISARGLRNKKSSDIALDIINREGIIFDKYCFGISEKEKTCYEEKIDIMIDDNYYNCQKLVNEKIYTLYFHSLGRKHLEDSKYLKEVYNWGEIYRYISNMHIR